MFGVIKRLFRAKLDSTKQQVEDWEDPEGTRMSKPCGQILIEGVDKVLHDNLMAKAYAAGVTFDGNIATLHGVVLEWLWDEVSGNLRVTAQKYPWYADCSEIESKIRQIVANAKQGAI